MTASADDQGMSMLYPISTEAAEDLAATEIADEASALAQYAPDMVGEVILDGTLTLADIQVIRDQGPGAVLGAPDYVLPMEAAPIEGEQVVSDPPPNLVAQELLGAIDRWQADCCKIVDKFEILAGNGTLATSEDAANARQHIAQAAEYLRLAAATAKG